MSAAFGYCPRPLERIPDYKINRVDELLPWNCAPGKNGEAHA